MTKEGRHQRGGQHRQPDERARDRQADDERAVVAPPVRRKEDERLGNAEIGDDIGEGDEDQGERHDAKRGRTQQARQNRG